MNKDKTLVILIIAFFLGGCSVNNVDKGNSVGVQDHSSIKNDTTPICEEADYEFLDSVENGNLKVLKEYLENGGNPMFECYDNSHYNVLVNRLVDRIQLSQSYELLEYYVEQPISKEHLNDLLTYYTTERDDRSVQLLINKGAREESRVYSCIAIDTIRQKYLFQLGYKVDSQSPPDGRTDFMYYAECPCPDGAEEIIESMAFLIRKGADPHIKSSNGKTALDYATHPDIINYLKSLP